MFVRGSGSGGEYRRVDNSFFRGIVVKNNDPDKLNRVKIYIPEITNQPYDDWLESHTHFILKTPGTNTNSEEGTWKDTKIFEEICDIIPWAEPCYPIMGESTNFRYYKDGKISTISDCNYKDGFTKNNDNPPDENIGAFSPAFLYDLSDRDYSGITSTVDAFSDPTKNFTGSCNPYAYSYRPNKHANTTKGIIAIPEVGSKVWVFHYEGDLNFPVYFGVMQDFRSISAIDSTYGDKNVSIYHPNNFEN